MKSRHLRILLESDFFRRLKKDKVAFFSLGLLFVIISFAVFADILAPHHPIRQKLPRRLESPSWEYIMGTDHLGRGIFSRIVYGARISLVVGLTTIALGVSGGILLGAISGYYGGVLDLFIMRCMDIMFAFPPILLSIALVAALGPSLENMILVLGIIRWAAYARLVRGQFLTLKEEEFVEAARAIGASDRSIIFRHILPNALSPILITATQGLGTVILEAAGLSFLGLGVQPPTPEWGLMLSAEREYLLQAPHAVFFPGLMIMLVVIGFALFGDGLRDTMDPRE